MISAKQADLLTKLCAGESIAYSALGRHLTGELQREQLVLVDAKGSKRTLRATDCKALKGYLNQYDELRPGISELSGSAGDTSRLRSGQAALTGNSKAAGVFRSCPGFPVNCWEALECILLGHKLTLNPDEGSFVYICDWQSFKIPKDTLVIGVENMENFRLIREQKTLFEAMFKGCKLLFVSRYPQSADLRRWLAGIPNRYVHFGDFDLAGINIYLTEFKKVTGSRASFLIPPDIESRLANGTRVRYLEQYAKFRALKSEDAELQHLIDIIHKYQKGYDQEGYIGAPYSA